MIKWRLVQSTSSTQTRLTYYADMSSIFVTVRQLRLISVGILETQCVSTTWKRRWDHPNALKREMGQERG